MSARLAAPMLVLALVACAPAPTLVLPSGSAPHDPQLNRVRTALEAEGLVFEPAGPHHVVGTDGDGNQVDLVGVPVEQVVITVAASDAASALVAARRYLPFARDLLHGSPRIWDWAAEAFACRAAGEPGCDTRLAHDGLSAVFTDDGPAYWVVAISRDQAG